MTFDKPMILVKCIRIFNAREGDIAYDICNEHTEVFSDYNKAIEHMIKIHNNNNKKEMFLFDVKESDGGLL